MKISIKSIINFLAALIVFSDAYASQGLSAYFELRGSYFILPFLLFLCLFLLGKLYFNRNFLIVFVILTFFSVASIFADRTTVINVTKVVVSILLNAITFYMVFKVNDFDVKEVFKVYLKLALVVSLIGIGQELNNIFKVLPEFGTTLALRGMPLYRITSIFPEPQHYCEAMVPAFFVALVSLFNRTELLSKWGSWIIIVSFLFTFSTAGYFGIFISIILLIINFKKTKYLLAGLIVVPFLMLFSYNNIQDVKIRVDGTYGVIKGDAKLISTNWSTFSLISNWEIGFISFIKNPLFGGGFGSHPNSYNKYIEKILGKDIDKLKAGVSIIPLNVEDAASLFNRLLSETGLIGLVSFIIFLLRCHVLKKNDDTDLLWIINNAALVFFLLKMLRGGHYFIYGVFLFFWVYYFSKIQSEKQMDVVGTTD